MPHSSLTPAPYANGLITVAVVLADRIIIASDSTSAAEALGVAPNAPRAIEVERGTVIAASGIWLSGDRSIDTAQAIASSYRTGDSTESFIQRFDQLYRRRLELFLTQRFEVAPDTVLHECFCPLVPPLSLVICEATAQSQWATIFEYIPRLSGQNEVTLTPLIHQQEPIGDSLCAAIGAAAPFVHLPEPQYIRQTMHRTDGPENTAKLLVEEAMVRMPAARRPTQIQTFPVGPGRPRSRRVRPSRLTLRARAAEAREPFPPVDTKNAAAVELFVLEKFNALYPSTEPTMIPRLFRDIAECFSGGNVDYAAIDVRYHDLEHTLQATVCLTLLLAGQSAARVSPRLDAHHFELAIAAMLLHDTGYLKLRGDTEGTGAKYTFCHVLRGCAFAAAYLPKLGATGTDLESVLSAINCTGPATEISRLRFPAPVDEIIGCMVATADFLGQMAASDYVEELEVLFQEFRESDEFLHVPLEQRSYQSAANLIARTPDFWRRVVLPKLETDFHGVYKFLARPYPSGSNAYLEAIETNIREVERLLRETPPIVAPASVAPPAATHSTAV